ncbi:MAG: hypothetical protein E6X43_10405 [Peptostreptococcaceae bacterium]|nr:hypothetical protein [Peptostreptococcaceae bacterium]
MSLKLAKANESSNDKHSLMCEQYDAWRKNQDKNQLGSKFFILFKDFEDHLRDIPPGPLKLYLYYGFNSKNETGISWHSIDTIKDYFNVSEKTINNWNSELIRRGLIERESKGNSRNKTTYLLPFSMNYIKEKDTSRLNNAAFKEVYGSLYKAYHLFQWRKNTQSEEYNVPYNTYVLVYERIVENAKNQYTAFEVSIEDVYKNVEINESVVKGIILRFNSNIKLKDIGVDSDLPIQGIAVNTQHDLKKKKNIYELVKELIDVDTDLSQYEEVKLVEIK